MATDGALLEWVSRGTARLVFRTYAWERPTLSLGRSEPFPEGWDTAALEREEIDVVRRPTGGSAVLHVDEVTFAIAASIPGPWTLTPRAFANGVAEALARALIRCGVAGSRVAAEARDPSSGGTVCFARSAPGEVLAGGYKIAGLASRFGRSGAFCHASVPLTRRSRAIARFLPGRPDTAAVERNARSLTELLGLDVEGAGAALGTEVAARLAEAVGERFGTPLHASPFAGVGILDIDSGRATLGPGAGDLPPPEIPAATPSGA
jgi:lipoate-protein ligase A